MATAETTRTREDIMTDVEDEIRTILQDDLVHGSNDYAYVRVYPDGSVTSGREASFCVPESEYYSRAPHPVTVWSASGMRSPAGREDGVFEWDEVEESRKWIEDCGCVYLIDDDGEQGEELPGVFSDSGKLYRLSDRLVENIDLEDELSEISDELDGFDWLPQ